MAGNRNLAGPGSNFPLQSRIEGELQNARGGSPASSSVGLQMQQRRSGPRRSSTAASSADPHLLHHAMSISRSVKEDLNRPRGGQDGPVPETFVYPIERARYELQSAIPVVKGREELLPSS